MSEKLSTSRRPEEPESYVEDVDKAFAMAHFTNYNRSEAAEYRRIRDTAEKIGPIALLDATNDQAYAALKKKVPQGTKQSWDAAYPANTQRVAAEEAVRHDLVADKVEQEVERQYDETPDRVENIINSQLHIKPMPESKVS